MKKEPKLTMLLLIRGRPDFIRRLYENVLETANNPEEIEFVLNAEDDDLDSHNIDHDAFNIQTIITKRGLGFGDRLRSVFPYCTGRYVFSMGDDVILKTPGWDKRVYEAFARFPDDIALVYGDDLIFGETLCTMPIVSRKVHEEIGYMNTSYEHFRVDDHMHHIYDLLQKIGHNRIVYMSDVIFEHLNFKLVDGKRKYAGNPAAMSPDGYLYWSTINERKDDAFKLAMMIDPTQEWKYRLRLRDIRDNFGCFMKVA